MEELKYRYIFNKENRETNKQTNKRSNERERDSGERESKTTIIVYSMEYKSYSFSDVLGLLITYPK
jgi:hypothetical protein